MDSIFRSAREKLEKEHRESKETGKLILERQKKDKEAKERQRQAVEASHRAKRLETIESLMNKEVSLVERQSRAAFEASQRARRFEAIEKVEVNLGDGDNIKEAIPIPPWMKKTNMPQRIAQKRDYDVFEWQVGDNAPDTGKSRRFIWNVRAEEETKKKTTDVGKKTEKQMD